MWCVYLTKNKTSTYLGHLRMRSHLLLLREISPAKFQYKSARNGVSRNGAKVFVPVRVGHAHSPCLPTQRLCIHTSLLFCPRNFVEISLMWPHLHTLRYLKTDTLYISGRNDSGSTESDNENAFYMKTRRKSCLIRAGLRVVSSYLSHTLLVRNAFTWSMLL